MPNKKHMNLTNHIFFGTFFHQGGFLTSGSIAEGFVTAEPGCRVHLYFGLTLLLQTGALHTQREQSLAVRPEAYTT